MLLSEWIERQGDGAISLLQRRSGLAYTTVFYAVRSGRARTVKTAEAIAVGTGGEVTAAEALGLPSSEGASADVA